ncbi:unnamed protein product [Schistosoma curassoni]|uniref:Uncharacterized protein n=1 Tax=Schistosoma curassoni TaxID=6186 RepID=A0A183JCU8_9TREM|nr:unnamed protein product [Schistosoma curassoni]
MGFLKILRISMYATRYVFVKSSFSFKLHSTLMTCKIFNFNRLIIT